MNPDTLTGEQVDLIRDAGCDFIDHRSGTFFRCHEQLPEVVAQQYRELVFAGWLELRGQIVQPTSSGRLAVQGATR